MGKQEEPVLIQVEQPALCGNQLLSCEPTGKDPIHKRPVFLTQSEFGLYKLNLIMFKTCKIKIFYSLFKNKFSLKIFCLFDNHLVIQSFQKFLQNF